MNVFTISLTNYCQLSCAECPAKEHLLKNRLVDARIHLDKLSKYISDMIKPDEFAVEITGGEPTYSPDLVPVLEMLRCHRVTVLTNTGNLQAVPHFGNAAFLCSWHENQMPYEIFKRNITESKNKCIAIVYPNKQDSKAAEMFENDGIPCICMSWNDDVPALWEICKAYGINPFGIEGLTPAIVPGGWIIPCAKCTAKDSYGNVGNYEEETREHFRHVPNKCGGTKICSTILRNEIVWNRFFKEA